MSNISQVEWLNQNALRAYPFQEDMQRTPCDSSGNLITDAVLPNYLIVDFIFTLVDQLASTRLYLSSLAVVGKLISLAFSENVTSQVACTVSLDRSVHVANTGYTLIGVGEWDDGRGRIVLGDLTNLPVDIADGLYSFTADQTLMEACVVRPALRGVRSIQIQDTGSVSAYITGRVRLVAGENIRLDCGLVGDESVIYISAEPNSNYADPCDCDSVLATNVLRTINGIPIEDVSFEAPEGSCLSIVPEGNKLVFKDTCSKPCCGCEELQFLTEGMRTLQAGISQLEVFVEQVDARISTFVTNYVLTL